VKRRQQPY